MPRKRKYKRRQRASGATWFVIKISLLCCFLLLVNAAACQLLCVFFQGIIPQAFEDLRSIQAIMYFGPILLICIEFWIYDRRVDYLARKSQHLENSHTDASRNDDELPGANGRSAVDQSENEVVSNSRSVAETV